MPSKPCNHPCCSNYVVPPVEYCELHINDKPSRARERQYYDQHKRNKASKNFYNSKQWQDARTKALAINPWCSRCLMKFADTVHHQKPLVECSSQERINQQLLMPLCAPCHSLLEQEIKAGEGG